MCAEADNSFLADLLTIQIMYSTDCYQHSQLRHNDTVWEAAGTHSSYQNNTGDWAGSRL